MFGTVKSHDNKNKAMEAINTICDGSSFEHAIIINKKTEFTGVDAIKSWLDANYPGYKLELQIHTSRNKSEYDVMAIETSEGIRKKIYFDISSFYGKH